MATPVVESHGASVAGVAIGLTGLDHATLESKYRFVVGIDYGTMYTSAYQLLTLVLVAYYLKLCATMRLPRRGKEGSPSKVTRLNPKLSS